MIATQEYSFTVTVRAKDDLPSLQTKEEVQLWINILLKNGNFLEVVSVTDLTTNIVSV